MEVQDPTKVRLLEAAGRSLPRRVLNARGSATICERAGANVAAVNYHFGDKEQLYVEAVLDAHRCGLEATDAEAADAAGHRPSSSGVSSTTS